MEKMGDPPQGSIQAGFESLVGQPLLAEEIEQVANSLVAARAAIMRIAEAFPLPFFSAIPLTAHSVEGVLAELAHTANDQATG